MVAPITDVTTEGLLWVHFGTEVEGLQALGGLYIIFDTLFSTKSAGGI